MNIYNKCDCMDENMNVVRSNVDIEATGNKRDAAQRSANVCGNMMFAAQPGRHSFHVRVKEVLGKTSFTAACTASVGDDAISTDVSEDGE